jgi:hypothetical protein
MAYNMNNGAGNGRGCPRMNIPNANQGSCVNQSTLVNSAVDACRNALICCCQGLKTVENNNLGSGSASIREAVASCRRALNKLKNILGCNAATEELRALRRCSEGVCDITRGCASIAALDIRAGIDDCKAGINECQQGLIAIENSVSGAASGSCT